MNPITSASIFTVWQGDINVVDGVPTLRCNFHNSIFSMEDGECLTWCSGVLGIKGTEGMAGLIGKFGGQANSPAKAYKVTVSGGRINFEV
jgi:nitrite reductase/ring-hydroxylating ferredoxin subunit